MRGVKGRFPSLAFHVSTAPLCCLSAGSIGSLETASCMRLLRTVAHVPPEEEARGPEAPCEGPRRCLCHAQLRQRCIVRSPTSR